MLLGPAWPFIFDGVCITAYLWCMVPVLCDGLHVCTETNAGLKFSAVR